MKIDWAVHLRDSPNFSPQCQINKADLGNSQHQRKLLNFLREVSLSGRAPFTTKRLLRSNTDKVKEEDILASANFNKERNCV